MFKGVLKVKMPYRAQVTIIVFTWFMEENALSSPRYNYRVDVFYEIKCPIEPTLQCFKVFL